MSGVFGLEVHARFGKLGHILVATVDFLGRVVGAFWRRGEGCDARKHLFGRRDEEAFFKVADDGKMAP